MKTLKVIGNCCLVFLAVIGVCISLAFCYYHYFVKDKTTGVNYISDQVPIDLVQNAEDLSSEQLSIYEDRVLFNVNYYSNAKNNGIELQELRLDYFTDKSLMTTTCRSTGMQYLGDFQTYETSVWTKDEADNKVVKDFYYYDTTNMISWSGGNIATQLNRKQLLTIKIDNRPFQIQLTGEYRTWHYKSKTFIGRWLGFDSYTDTYYDYGDVFYDVMNAVKSNSAGYGDYYITVDLSKYFTVYEYNENTGKFVEDTTSDVVKNYAVLKFHYDENGARNSTQSLFGIIECNSKYDIVEDKIDTTYWQERMLYTLTEKDFNYRYSDVYNGYFASLNLDTKKMFADMPRAKVNIILNLQSQYLKDNKINIVGFDYNGLENFEIDTLTIAGESQTFYLLEKSLYNTNLQTLKYSSGITFDFSYDAINNEYTGVVL